MGKENGYSAVKSWFMTPEQQADHNARLRTKVDGPQIKRWKRSMTQEQYLQAVESGQSAADIMLKHFNNDRQEFAKQLKEWGIKKMAETKTGLTKDEYLRRRAAGEGRTQIFNTLAPMSKRNFNSILSEWGIREGDAEQRALEMLVPNAAASAEPQGLIAINAAREQEAESEALNRIQERAAEKDVEILTLQNQLQKEIDNNDELEAENLRFATQLTDAQAEIAILQQQKAELIEQVDTAARAMEYETAENAKMKTALESASDKAAEAGRKLKKMDEEQQILLATLEQAAEQAAIQENDIITLCMPILSVAIANVERARIYDAVGALSSDVEAADIDRERVMQELFDLLQRVVNFVTADLAELHPGQSVAEFVHDFFGYYNSRHIDNVTAQQEAV
ncbi:hypothetical protein SAMN04487969_11938 [Paenibacillus algorifonticola]|uniref:Uncharacterized protein n=1 Tax=Paenibacillus algorifonticola TaxID=684063 RepID=A0A1I2H1K9_9BACL|nr:hypothetical protein [Paenibacillus algorifonticola]SFF22696.1 hypothetical protein SAMN04487969_11938 [Paenibacillus algorifonticola]